MITTKDPCRNCGATNWHYWRLRYIPQSQGDDLKEESCSECSTTGTPNLSPDVYFDESKGSNQTDPNLCDRYTGPIPFSSKREKAAIMQKLKLQEAGDKIHGSRNFDKIASKQWENR